ncbi:MAG: hypothetical protein ACE5KT_05195 [Methanosarcinales archaeon]
MISLNEQYITDRKGNRTAVILEINQFNEIMRLLKKYERLEEEYDTLDVTADIIEAFKDLKEGRARPARELLNEL